jgi:hypothetical protein
MRHRKTQSLKMLHNTQWLSSSPSIMDEYGFSRAELIQALGYRDVERGLRRLNPERILNQTAAYPGHAEL